MDDKTVRRRKTFNKLAERDVTDRIKYGGRTNAQTSERKCGFCKILLIIFALIIFILALGYVFSPIKAVAIEGIVDVPFEGVFSINKKLASGTRIPNLPGPECIVEDDEGNLYTGLHDGRIVKIHRSPGGVIGVGRIENITSGVIHGADTDDIPHGRPLGLRLRKDVLYVMDAVYGFLSLNLTSKKIAVLVPPSAVHPSLQFSNDLDITSDGKIAYFTQTSSKWALNEIGLQVVEGLCNGRLFKYTFASKKLEILVSDLCFCNGVQLSPDEKTLIVAEIIHYRIKMIDVETLKIKHVLSTPMMPDNIRLNDRGTFWVCGANPHTFMLSVLYGSTMLRQALAGLLSDQTLTMLLFEIFFNTEHTIVLEVSLDGRVLQSLHDPHGELIKGASHAVTLSDGRIAVGSFSFHSLAIYSIS